MKLGVNERLKGKKLYREVWKPVITDKEDYTGLYEVSNLGRVRSLDRYDNRGCKRKGQIRKTKKDKGGYYRIILCKNDKQKDFLVHRLVALAFIPNPNKLPIINHKDCCPSNNRADNLEWCNYSYNNTYKDAIAKRNESRLKSNPNGECWKKTAEAKKKPILQYDVNGNLIAEYPSATDASLINKKFKRENISLVLNGKTKTAYGYVWKYKL